MTRPLVLPRDLHARLIAAARARSPREACGLLVARAGVIVALPELENVAADPHEHHAFDPRAFAAAARAAEDELDAVTIGTWHAHPRGDALPSSADLLPSWPEARLLVVGLGVRPSVGLGTGLGGDAGQDLGADLGGGLGDHHGAPHRAHPGRRRRPRVRLWRALGRGFLELPLATSARGRWAPPPCETRAADHNLGPFSLPNPASSR